MGIENKRVENIAPNNWMAAENYLLYWRKKDSNKGEGQHTLTIKNIKNGTTHILKLNFNEDLSYLDSNNSKLLLPPMRGGFELTDETRDILALFQH